MSHGFTLVEFSVSLFLLSILVTIGFMFFNFHTEMVADTVEELEIQGNIRFAAAFINNLLINSQLSDVTIWKGIGDSNKLLVKNTHIRLAENQLKVDHQYPSSKENYLASYVTGFKVTNVDGLISVKLTGGNTRNADIISVDIVVYMGD